MGDSAMVTMVAFSSAPVASRVMPPVASTAMLPSESKPVVTRIRVSSRDDRSPEIATGSSPFFTLLKSFSAPE